MKRVLSVFVVLVILLGLLAGCGATESTVGGNTETTAAASETLQEKVTIRVQTRWSGTDSYAPMLQYAIEEFTSMNPNITILDESINEEDAYNNKLRSDIATGNMAHIVNPPGSLDEYVKSDLYLDLKPYLESDPEWFNAISPAAFADSKVKGFDGLYAMPLSLDYLVFYYNTDIFKQAGIDNPPITYDELLSAIDKLKALGGINPISVGAKDLWPLHHLHNGLFYRMVGVQKARDLGEGKAKWTDADVVATIQAIKELYDIGALDKDAAGIDYATSKTSFLAGKSAMIYAGTWFTGEVLASPIADKVETFMFPYFKEYEQFKGDGVVFSAKVCVNNQVPQAEKDAAVAFLKYLTSKEFQEKCAYEATKATVRTDLTIDAAKTGKIFSQVSGFAAGLTDGGQDTTGYDPNPAVQDRLRNSMVDILLGGSAEECAAAIQAEKDKK